MANLTIEPTLSEQIYALLREQIPPEVPDAVLWRLVSKILIAFGRWRGIDMD